MPPPNIEPASIEVSTTAGGRDDWTGRILPRPSPEEADDANVGVRREPELPEHEEVAPFPAPTIENEFELDSEEPNDDALRQQLLAGRVSGVARQASLDPNDGIEL